MSILTPVREAMMLEFKDLRDRYACLQYGESLNLEFDVEINERLSSPNQTLQPAGGLNYT